MKSFYFFCLFFLDIIYYFGNYNNLIKIVVQDILHPQNRVFYVQSAENLL